MSETNSGPNVGPVSGPDDDSDPDRTHGRVSLGDRVAWLDLAERGQDAVYVSTLPDGPPMVLHATAALIFLVGTRGGTLDEVVAGVAQESGQPLADIRDDVLGFVDELVRLGLLTRTG